MQPKRYGIAIKEFDVVSDHVHIIVFLLPEMSVSKAINLLQGSSSHDLI